MAPWVNFSEEIIKYFELELELEHLGRCAVSSDEKFICGHPKWWKIFRATLLSACCLVFLCETGSPQSFALSPLTDLNEMNSPPLVSVWAASDSLQNSKVTSIIGKHYYTSNKNICVDNIKHLPSFYCNNTYLIYVSHLEIYYNDSSHDSRCFTRERRLELVNEI